MMRQIRTTTCLAAALVLGTLAVTATATAAPSHHDTTPGTPALHQLLQEPYQHLIQPEVASNGIKMSFFLIMTASWIMFGVLAVLKLPLLTLWMLLGLFTVVVGFVQLGPLTKFHVDS
mmetsp:Transcript_14007/g.30301  ORF Transcript_14007/g.30301 Transcript_14007/m.30301 type:complete len:118 (+) Transcript_14007:119-472(+)